MVVIGSVLTQVMAHYDHGVWHAKIDFNYYFILLFLVHLIFSQLPYHPWSPPLVSSSEFLTFFWLVEMCDGEVVSAIDKGATAQRGGVMRGAKVGSQN